MEALEWTKPYNCDADHINLRTAERFLAYCDFYTIDVVDYIAKTAAQSSVNAFRTAPRRTSREIKFEGCEQRFEITPSRTEQGSH